MNVTNLNFSSPQVMGILNITPDSFYDGGKYTEISEIIFRTETMLDEGASIIDIGAYSSRPGAQHINSTEEFNRLAPAISEIKKRFPNSIISIDTFRSEIAEKIYKEFGHIIINDISGGIMDANIMNVCGKYSLPYICMHMQGTPQTMQENPTYTNVTHEVLLFLQKQFLQAKECGIKNIILDPGFGFGKTVEQNFELLQNLQEFIKFKAPILVGFSRKSMICKTLNCNPQEALNGTTILNTIALQKGASIFRVHDVKQAVETITLYKKMLNN